MSQVAMLLRGVAQFGSARALGAWGRRFESCHPDQMTWPRGQAVKTSPFHGGNRGSIPLGVINADVAQLAEQLICNQQVIGSSPIIGLHFTYQLCILV